MAGPYMRGKSVVDGWAATVRREGESSLRPKRAEWQGGT